MATKQQMYHIYIYVFGGISIIFLFFIYFFTKFGEVHVANKNEEISFRDCQIYIFEPDNQILYLLYKKIHSQDYREFLHKCDKKYPHKRDNIVEIITQKDHFLLAQHETERKKIIIPENTILEKSHFEIIFQVSESDTTYKTTYFGYSLGGMQNRNNVIKIGGSNESIITQNFTLDELSYNGDLELIVTNLQGKTMDISYNIEYYTEY